MSSHPLQPREPGEHSIVNNNTDKGRSAGAEWRGSCPGAAVLEAVAGEGSDDAVLLSHLSSCDACRVVVEEIKENNLFLGRVRGSIRPEAALFEEREKSIPDAVPGYKLLRELHRGGQGIVYLAEQESTRRRVAIKMLLRGAFSTARQRGRFEREVEVASQLRHPNIVTVYDSLPLAGGRFALVMEYVEGRRLDEWAGEGDLRGAGIAARGAGETRLLGAFGAICAAVHYAHQRGVIHRDLKPDNIIVDNEDRPRVLDFGIAKITSITGGAGGGGGGGGQEVGGEKGEYATMTQPGEFAGTLAYASPEQLSGESGLIDTRSDIYALGVLLYELLTGRMPYDVSGPFMSVVDRVMHAEPTSPTLAAPGIDDDLATIILRCLEKEPARRYQSAAELLADLLRYQAGDAIDAKRASRFYVVRKWALRRRAAVTAAASLVVAAVVGLSVGSYALAQRAQRKQVEEAKLGETSSRIMAEAQREKAERARAAAEEVRGQAEAARVFMSNILNSVSPGAARGRRVSMAFMLEQAESQLAGGALAKAGRAAVAEVKLTLGRTYSELGETAKAVAHLTASRDLFSELAAGADEGELLAESALGTKYLLLAATAGDSLARALCRGGDLEAARVEALEALRTRQRIAGEGSEQAAASLATLGEVELHHGRFDESKSALSRALSILELALPAEAPELVDTRTMLAQALWQSGAQDHAGAERMLRDSLKYYRAGTQADHPAIADCLYQLAHVLTSSGGFEEAEALARECVQQRTRLFGADHRIVAGALDLAAGIAAVRGKLRDAEPMLVSAAAIYRAAAARAAAVEPAAAGPLGQRDDCQRELASTLANLGSIYYKQGNYQQAEPVLKEWYGLVKGFEALDAATGLELGPKRRLPGGTDEAELARARLERLYEDWEKPEEAEKWRRQQE